MTVASLALTVAAMALLALSMHRHAAAAGRRRAAGMRQVGGLALLASFAVGIAQSGWRLGPIEWIGQLAPCAAAVTVLLTYRPALLPRVPVPALTVALVAAVVSATARG